MGSTGGQEGEKLGLVCKIRLFFKTKLKQEWLLHLCCSEVRRLRCSFPLRCTSDTWECNASSSSLWMRCPGGDYLVSSYTFYLQAPRGWEKGPFLWVVSYPLRGDIYTSFIEKMDEEFEILGKCVWMAGPPYLSGVEHSFPAWAWPEQMSGGIVLDYYLRSYWTIGMRSVLWFNWLLLSLLPITNLPKIELKCLIERGIF